MMAVGVTLTLTLTTSKNNKPDHTKLHAAETVDMNKVNAARSKTSWEEHTLYFHHRLSSDAFHSGCWIEIQQCGNFSGGIFFSQDGSGASGTLYLARLATRHSSPGRGHVLYHSNSQIANLDVDQPGLLLGMKAEKSELLQRLDATISLTGDLSPADEYACFFLVQNFQRPEQVR
jgi:hypothetical protein